MYDAKFENYKYSDGQRHVALCLYIERNGEELAEPEPLTMGTGWDIIDGGERVEGRNGQTGLSPSCKLAIFLKALEDLNENEMPTDYFAKASDLIGIDGELISHMMDKIEDRGDRGRGRDRGGDRGGRSSSPKLLVYESVTDAPWLASTSKSKGKPESRRASTRDRDEDRDERPTGKNRSDSRTNGKGDKGDDKYSEIASELLAGLLEDGPLNIKDAADAVHDAAKKDKKYRDEADAIAEAVDQALIDSELAWTVDGKKLVASQPEDDSDKDEKDDKRARR